MNKFFTFLFFYFFFNNLCAQLPPESDPHRGMYIDKFLKTRINNSSIVDPYFSILSVDTNSDGIFEKEDAYLNYACENHITYIAMYDLYMIIGGHLTAWNENTKQYENLEKHLCRFIEKAKHEYGITQIGAIGASAGFFSDLETYMNKYPVISSGSCNSCQADFDVLLVEDEYWGNCAANLPGFINIIQAMYSLKQTYNAAHPLNPLITEGYIAFLNGCPNPGGAATAEIMDGCKNCSPYAGLPNPNPRLLDRILYTTPQTEPYYWNFTDQNVFENLQTFDSTDYHPLLYSESLNSGALYDWMGPWLVASPINTIFYVDEWYYYWWYHYSGTALGQPNMNNVQRGGTHWYSASSMVGFLENPQMILSLHPFCATNDSVKINLSYYGPTEIGTDYEYWISRDSGQATIYPSNGTKFTGTTIWNPADPTSHALDFNDSLVFPPCYLPKGNYTAHLNLHYNHSTGCSYSCENKFIVDNRARLQVSGDTAFCHGHETFLCTNSGAAGYAWYRNNILYNSLIGNILRVTEEGNYFCIVTGGSCSSNTDTIHITVHPLPEVQVNAFCNGNGTVTLKTNLLNANPSSNELRGPGGVTYRWNTGEVTDQITINAPSSKKSYRVIVTDPYSKCSMTRYISVPNPLSTTYTGIINVNQQPSTACSNDGSITAALSPAPLIYDPIDYLWSTGARAATISNLPPGTYSVAMNHYKNACSIYASVTIGSIPANGPALNETIVNSNCVNNSTGSITLQPTGGNPPFSFSWDNIPNENGYNSTSQNLANLYPGIYDVSITDSAGCEFRHSFTIGQNNVPVNISVNSVQSVTGCGTNQNGSASIQVTGVISPSLTTWTDLNGQSASPTHLHGGTYKVVVTSGTGCTGSALVQIPVDNTIIEAELIDSSVTTVCDSMSRANLYLCVHNGAAPYTVNAPWLIDSNFVRLENIPAGNYQLTITDSAGCFVTDTFIVDSAGLNLTVVPQHTTCIGCSNGGINITFGGGVPPISISWSPSNGILSGQGILQLPADSYLVCITDSNSCQLCKQVIVLDDPLLVTSIDDNNSINIYPNPASQFIMLNTKLDYEGMLLAEVNDLYGRNIFQNKFRSNTEIKINTSEWSAGIYFLNIRQENHNDRKVIKLLIN